MSKTALVFPGQGSQSVGMLAELASEHSLVLDTFNQASQKLGYDLWSVVQEDKDDRLNSTEVTQPALLTASVAIWRVMQQQGMAMPDYMAGHSLGEYSALVCAGVMTLDDGVELVQARGQFMQQAVPAGSGAMFAIIGLDDEKIITACSQAQQQSGEIVAAVNFNSPGQVVIAGSKTATEMAAQQCKELGAKRALPLSVSVPSHCALMKPAAEQLSQLIESVHFEQPQVPVINNVDVQSPTAASDIKHALVRQLYCPVRWTETVQYLAAQGVTQAYEVGPGKVLSGLIKRIDKTISIESINSPASLELVAK